MRANPFTLSAFSLILAAALWILVFVFRPLNFWIMLSLATFILLVVALVINRDKASFRIGVKPVLVGLISASLLYLLFYFGFLVTKSNPIFSEGVGRVYDLRTAPSLMIGLALIFPIGPGEEIYWRGLIQRRFSNQFGPTLGLLAGTSAYTLVHLPTLNVPLMLTAFVGGLVWGYIYMTTKSLIPVTISHIVFDLLIFVLLPLA